MLNKEVDCFYFVSWLFNLKFYACFVFVISVVVLGTKYNEDVCTGVEAELFGSTALVEIKREAMLAMTKWT